MLLLQVHDSGWTYCRAGEQEGWVPTDILRGDDDFELAEVTEDRRGHRLDQRQCSNLELESLAVR